MKPAISILTLVNDERMYRVSSSSLAAQHEDSELQWIPLYADLHGWNAAQGLNVGLERAEAEWVVCAHQDVLFPNGWWERAAAQLARWPGRLAVAGLVGMTRGGRSLGHVLDPHGHCRWGRLPERATSVDEHVIILRRSTDLRFDPEIPGFHCYGTDIVQQAGARGLDAIVIDAPVVHLSRGRLDQAYSEAAAVLLEKWGDALDGVIPTCAGVVSRKGPATLIRRLQVEIARRRSRAQQLCVCSTLQLKTSEVQRP